MATVNRPTTTLKNVANVMKAFAHQMADTGKHENPIMMHSSPGVGKSSAVHQVADEIAEMFSKSEHFSDKKFRVIDVRLGAMEAADIQGIPFVDDGEMKFSTPEWFPKQDECGILFLDELSNAAIPCQQAAYRLVLDREIHNGTKLPEGFLIVAAGNNKQDKTGAKGLVPALASRFSSHFYVEANKEEFLQYGFRKGFNGNVLGLVAFRPDLLVTKMEGDEYGFANPRNWESVSKILNNPYLDEQEESTKTAIYGAVGRSVATELYGFIEYNKFLPDFDKVENDQDYKLDEKFESKASSDLGVRFALMMATMQRMVRRLSESEHDKVENLSNLLNVLDKSTRGMAVRMMYHVDNAATNSVFQNEKKMPKTSKIFMEAIHHIFKARGGKTKKK